MTDRTVTARLQLDVAKFIQSAERSGKALGEVGLSAQKLQRDLAGMEAQQQKASDSIEGIAKAEKKAADERRQAMQEAGQATLVSGATMVAVFTAAQVATIGFDTQISAVGAAAGATSKQLDALRASALQAGADTAFSAREAAQGEEELAKAGVSVASITGGALKGSLDLAAAGNISVAESAEIAATAMTVFKLSGAGVPHVADVIAASAGKAQGNVGQLGQAMQQSALVARQTGLKLEDTAGALAMFASNGLLGSDSGTAFKTMLQRLTPQSDAAAEKMDELGLRAFDAQGKFVGLSAYADQLRDGLSGLSDEQRSATMNIIFGSDAVRAAAILYSEGGAGVDRWRMAVDDAGYASEQAAARLDNLGGDLERLKGSIEVALIGGGSQATGFLRSMAQGADEMVNQFNDLPPVLQGVAFSTAGVGGSALVALGGIGTLLPRVQEARESLTKMGSAGVAANKALGALGKVSITTGGITALYLAVESLSDKLYAIDVAGVDELTASAKTLAASGNLKQAGFDAEHLAGAVRDTQSSMADGASIFEKFKSGAGDLAHGNLKAASMTEAFAQSIEASAKEITNLDAALAGLVGGGDIDVAKAAFLDLTMELREQGLSMSEINEAFPSYNAALSNVQADSLLATEGIAGTSQALEDNEGAAKEAEDAAKGYAAALDMIAGKNISATEALIGYKDDLISLTDAFKENGHTLDMNTQKGRDNMSAFLDAASGLQDYAATVMEQTGSQELANQKLKEGQVQLRRTLEQAGFTKAQIDKLILTYSGIPPKKNTDLTATDHATPTVHSVRREIDKIKNRTITLTIRAIGTGVIAGAIGRADFSLAEAEGGYISGPGTSTSDSIPARLSDGEYVIKAAAVDRYGIPFFDALNTMRVPQLNAGGYTRHTEMVRHTQTMSRETITQAMGAVRAELIPEDRALLSQVVTQGVRISGEFRARGRDLVAVVDNQHLSDGRR